MNWKPAACFCGLMVALVATVVSCTTDSTAPADTATPAARTTQQKVDELNAQYGWMGRFHTDALAYVYKKLSQNPHASHAQQCRIIGRAVKEFAKTFRKGPGSVGVNTDGQPDDVCSVAPQLSASLQIQTGSAQSHPRSSYETMSSLFDQMVNAVDAAQYSYQVERTVYYLENLAASTLSGDEAGAVFGAGSIAVSSANYWDANEAAWTDLSGGLMYSRVSTSSGPTRSVLAGSPNALSYGFLSPLGKKILKADIRGGISVLLTGALAGGPIGVDAAAFSAATASAIAGISIFW